MSSTLQRLSLLVERPVRALMAVPFLVLVVSASAALSLGCTPSIGDKCVLSTDCSLQGDRLCDTSEPAGYCTIFNCRGNLCPDTAACVMFNASIQGCGYDDRASSRTSRTFCLSQCHSNSDCRESDGYVCADPRLAPWSAVILDDNQLQRVCIVKPPNGLIGGQVASVYDAGVCSASNPPVPPIDASPATTADADFTLEAGADAGLDAGIDASDAAVLDAADAGG